MTRSAGNGARANGHAKDSQAHPIAKSTAAVAGRDGIGVQTRPNGKASEAAVVNNEVVARAAALSDQAEARAIVRKIHETAYEVQWGGEVEALAASVVALTAEDADLKAEIERCAKERDATPDWRVESDLSQPAVPLWRWRLAHLGGLVSSLAGLAACFAAGGYTAYVNLEGSDLPVIIENPYAAPALAVIVPVASLALKSFSGLFSTERAKRWFRRTIIGASIPVALFWMIGATEKYSGFDSGVDFTEADSLFADWFVFSQLLLELLAGAAFALNIERSFDLYTPKRRSPEERKEWLDRRIEVLKTQRGVITDAIAAKKGRLSELASGRVLQCEVADLLYRHRRQAFADLD